MLDHRAHPYCARFRFLFWGQREPIVRGHFSSMTLRRGESHTAYQCFHLLLLPSPLLVQVLVREVESVAREIDPKGRSRVRARARARDG